MENKFQLQKDRGFVAFYISILALIVMLGVVVSLAVLTVNQEKIYGNIVRTTQSYFASEAGIEDALLRIIKNKKWSSSYNLSVGSNTSTVKISDIIGGSRTITSTGNVADRIRKIQVAYTIDSDNISFHYGVQVGNLGLEMNSNAVVHGNIFSNGPINGASNTKIYGDAISAGPDGLINNTRIDSAEGGGNALATNLTNCVVLGDAHYVNISSCSVEGNSYTPEEGPAPENMPITQTQITSWKTDAVAGGTIPGFSLGGNNKASLGPKKVDGDMALNSNAQLTLTGTIWVTGNLNLNSNVVVKLDPGYGSSSGVIIVDGKISVDSNVVFCGAEGYKGGGKCNASIGSYLMLLSTYNSIDPDDSSIYATSNTNTAILYTSDGFIKLGSNAKLREATGYGISMSSNSEIRYEVGLADTRFTSGPGGSWKVTNWKEIE